MRAMTWLEKLLKYPGGGVSCRLSVSKWRNDSKLVSIFVHVGFK